MCVPSKCPRKLEKMLGWHLSLKKFGFDGATQQSRSPKRSQVLLRLGSQQELQAAREVRSVLATPLYPSWYLQPFNWQARPSRLGFPIPTLTRTFFETRWGMYVVRLQIILRKRVAFCPIPKVGLTQFYMLMNRVGHVNVSYTDFLDSGSRFDVRVAGWFAAHDYWRDPRWKFVVFVRDPLERFLSAFLDKCLKPSPHCGDDDKVGWQNVSRSSSWAEKLRAFRIFVALPVPTPKMLQNDHWIPQSLYLQHGCGFTWQRLDFVGFMTSDKWRMNVQIRAMLHSLGLSLHRAGQLADEFFPVQGFASSFLEGHANLHRGEPNGRLLRRFYGHKETIQQVLRFSRQE